MRLFEATVLFEADLAINGYSYLTIYGKHINGYYCCIPNWNIGCEMAEPSDTFYNAERLKSAGLNNQTAKLLAKKVYEVCNTLNLEEPFTDFTPSDEELNGEEYWADHPDDSDD